MSLVLLLAGELASVVALWALGGVEGLDPLRDPGSRTDLALLVAGSLRLAGLALALWLLATSAAYALAVWRRRVPSWLAAVTLRAVRGVVARAVGATLVVAATPSAALAVAAPPPAVAGAPADAPDPAAPPHDPQVPPHLPAPLLDLLPPGGRHTVAPGDNLWVIARAQLPPGAGDREVHAYWLALIAANVERLASGDPDVIHPGEVLVLPEVGP